MRPSLCVEHAPGIMVVVPRSQGADLVYLSVRRQTTISGYLGVHEPGSRNVTDPLPGMTEASVPDRSTGTDRDGSLTSLTNSDCKHVLTWSQLIVIGWGTQADQNPEPVGSKRLHRQVRG